MNLTRIFLSIIVCLSACAVELRAQNSTGQEPEKAYTMGTGNQAVTYEIDSKQTGFLRGVKVGQKKLVDANDQPPLIASVLESARYDGFSDFAGDDGGKVIDAAYHVDHCTAQKKGDNVELTTTGQLAFPGGDAIAFEMHTTLEPSGHVGITVQAKPSGTFKNRYLRQFALRLPLALDLRKRIVQGGDRGMRFDTRAIYQYQAETKFLEVPDFNFWQHFWIDQSSPVDYYMWRSESLATSPLTEFRGRLAPGWMTAYDQTGGVLLSYKDMPQHAPKALYIHAPGVAANGPAAGVVYFHAPTHPAMDFHDVIAAGKVFDILHQTDWIFFQGKEGDVKPDQMLEKIWNQKLASDAPECADPELDKINLLDAKLTAGTDAPLVVGGVPFPQGAVTALTQLELSQNGQVVPLQTKTLGYWPDGSFKWVLLTFPLDADKNLSVAAGKSRGPELPLTITLRNDKVDLDHRDFVLRYGKDSVGGTTTSSLKASAAGDVVQITTGPLELKLGTGERWLQEVKLNGREMLRSDAKQPLCFADFVHTDKNWYPPNTVNPQGHSDDGALVVDKISLEESGPLRAIVRLEGMTNSKEPQRVILRLEAYAGRSYVRLFHSIEFRTADQRFSYVRRMGISLPLELDTQKKARASAGGQGGELDLGALARVARVGISQDNYLHYSVWRQDMGAAGADRFRTIVQDGNRSRGWLDVSDSRGGLTVVLRNMWQEAPSELVLATAAGDAHGTNFNVDLWPESAPPMDVRRYSNYQHVSQGESPLSTIDWVDKSYYPRESFVGVSKTHEMLLYFHDGAVVPSDAVVPSAIDSLAADFQSPALIYAGAKWYLTDTKIILPTILPGDANHALVDQNMQNCAQFILFHQRYWNWYGKWDFGDARHMFKRGYGKIYPAAKLAELLKMPPAQRDVAKKGQDNGAVQDYWPEHDWAYDNGRWGWSNTESLTNFFMQREYFRTGNRDLYFFTESAAREARDVVMRHEVNGLWFGEGTRHGVQHWSDGDHEPREAINTEFRYHYLLSGDLRSAEFSKQLTEFYYMKAPLDADSEATSARLFGLLTNWEMTHDPAVGQALQTYIHGMCLPEGFDSYTPADFPSGKVPGHPHKPNDTSMWFQYFGGMPAVLEYYELTHDATLRQAIITYADNSKGEFLDGGDHGKYGTFLAQAFAARYADHPEPYRKALAERLDDWMKWSNAIFQTFPADHSHWTGLSAPVTHYPGALFWLNTEGYVLGALDKEPTLSPEQSKKMNELAVYHGQLEKGQPSVQVPVLRESWQSDFDDPALKDYTVPKRPLEP